MRQSSVPHVYSRNGALPGLGMDEILALVQQNRQDDMARRQQALQLLGLWQKEDDSIADNQLRREQAAQTLAHYKDMLQQQMFANQIAGRQADLAQQSFDAKTQAEAASQGQFWAQNQLDWEKQRVAKEQQDQAVRAHVMNALANSAQYPAVFNSLAQMLPEGSRPTLLQQEGTSNRGADPQQILNEYRQTLQGMKR